MQCAVRVIVAQARPAPRAAPDSPKACPGRPPRHSLAGCPRNRPSVASYSLNARNAAEPCSALRVLRYRNPALPDGNTLTHRCARGRPAHGRQYPRRRRVAWPLTCLPSARAWWPIVHAPPSPCCPRAAALVRTTGGPVVLCPSCRCLANTASAWQQSDNPTMSTTANTSPLSDTSLLCR
jgi:hypothetical protein